MTLSCSVLSQTKPENKVTKHGWFHRTDGTVGGVKPEHLKEISVLRVVSDTTRRQNGRDAIRLSRTVDDLSLDFMDMSLSNDQNKAWARTEQTLKENCYADRRKDGRLRTWRTIKNLFGGAVLGGALGYGVGKLF